LFPTSSDTIRFCTHKNNNSLKTTEQGSFCQNLILIVCATDSATDSATLIGQRQKYASLHIVQTKSKATTPHLQGRMSRNRVPGLYGFVLLRCNKYFPTPLLVICFVICRCSKQPHRHNCHTENCAVSADKLPLIPITIRVCVTFAGVPHRSCSERNSFTQIII